MEFKQAREFVEEWLWTSLKRATDGMPWIEEYKKDATSMVLEAVNAPKAPVDSPNGQKSESAERPIPFVRRLEEDRILVQLLSQGSETVITEADARGLLKRLGKELEKNS